MKNLFLMSIAIFAISFTSDESKAQEFPIQRHHLHPCIGDPSACGLIPILDPLPHHQFNAPKKKLENLE